jgi:hypothetical protein
MSHRYKLKFSYTSKHIVHQLLVSLSSFYARSSVYGYLTDGFETKNADAYIFIAPENHVGHQPHPDLEVVIEPYGLYINAFENIAELEHSFRKAFGVVEIVF